MAQQKYPCFNNRFQWSILFSMIFLLSVFNFSVYGQRFNLEGKITDSISQPLPNSNIIAKPISKEGEITFAISDKNGAYKLKLSGQTLYKIEITSLGFSTKTDSLKIHKNTVKDYVLDQSFEELEQVIVEAKMAMIVKEDTITYRTDQFKTGDERKLREVLKKLPGVEVDREGNVSVNGKKVTKLMVDGKDFFGGNTRLAVNNIPADAVDEVEALDNYHEVSFMKGLSDSDRMAMNIKLKADKKNFVFGESEAGAGIKKRYYIHPALFYYSPKTTLNFIGSLNNINDSPLSASDVSRFRGGNMGFSNNPIQSGDEGLSNFSSSSSIKQNNMKFAAANITQEISKKISLGAYSIIAYQNKTSESEAQTEYLTQDNMLEDRHTQHDNKGFSNFNKLRLRYIPDVYKDLAYDALVNISNYRDFNHVNSIVNDSLNQTGTNLDPRHVEINQYFRYNTQPTYAHTSEIKGEYSFKQSDRLSKWDFDRPVFSDIIPFVDDPEAENYHFNQDYSSTTNSGRFNFKHYWVLNNTNHIYPVGGLYFFNQTYKTTDYQQLANGSFNNFFDSGFNNDLRYQLIDPYLGFQYKFKIGSVIFKPGLVYHHYFWSVNQFAERLVRNSKGVFLPEFRLEFKSGVARKLIFNYGMKSTFADAEEYANRLSLQSFNLLYRGNEKLENSLYHSFSIDFSDFDISSGISYSIGLGYKRQEKSVNTATTLDGIDRVSEAYYSSFPEEKITFRTQIRKTWDHLAAGFSTYYLNSKYNQIVNNEALDYKADGFAYRVNARTIFKDLPNITFGFQHNISHTSSEETKNRYTVLNPFVLLRYSFWNDFILKSDYKYKYTKDHNRNQSQNFQLMNASLYYNKEDSPWGFEVRVDNLFDVRYQRQHYINQFMIYDRLTYIQPRTVLFILSYRL